MFISQIALASQCNAHIVACSRQQTDAGTAFVYVQLASKVSAMWLSQKSRISAAQFLLAAGKFSTTLCSLRTLVQVKFQAACPGSRKY